MRLAKLLPIPLLFAGLMACDDAAESTPTPCEPTAAAECYKVQKSCVVDTDTAAPTCVRCAPGNAPLAADGQCAPIPGTAMTHTFADYTLQPGEEIGSLCRTWILDNDTELWVNAVELRNDGGYHHSNWFFVPEDFKDWPTEPWKDCYSGGFGEIDAALAGGVLYAQSTQVRFELQKFQTGAAVRIPPRSRIIGATHLLNIQPEAFTTGLDLTIHTVDPAEVTAKLSPAQLVYHDLAIPAEERSVVGGMCNLEVEQQKLFDAPLDMKIHYILPHYHALGDSFSVTIVGGPRDGEQLVDLGAFDSSDPFGRVFDPPVDLTGATGLSFTCGFDNPTSEVVEWGIGDQEMCEALMFIESPMAFSASIGETSDISELGGLEYHTGSCNVLAFPFSQEK